jgi:hypothetical protein
MAAAENHLEIPVPIMERDGPFKEFKQDAAFVSVELTDGRKFENLLILYPNRIAAMKGASVLPFDPRQINRVFQTAEDLKLRSSSTWALW